MPPRQTDAEHVLYRLWAKDGTLLWIGQTRNMRLRLQGHRSEQPWREEIASYSVHPNWWDELDLIHDEDPVYNIAGRHGYERNGAKLIGYDGRCWRCDRESYPVNSSSQWRREEKYRKAYAKTPDTYKAWAELLADAIEDRLYTTVSRKKQLERLWKRYCTWADEHDYAAAGD
jgi:hypothetical protein